LERWERARRRVALAPEGILARGAIEKIFRRSVNQTGRGPAVLDERDIDRELPVPLQELLGAVERVHGPELAPVAPQFVGGFLDGFFRQHRDAGKPLAEPRRDQPVRAQVRLGDGGAVLFSPRLDVGVIDLHDHCAGPPAGLDQVIHIVAGE